MGSNNSVCCWSIWARSMFVAVEPVLACAKMFGVPNVWRNLSILVLPVADTALLDCRNYSAVLPIFPRSAGKKEVEQSSNYNRFGPVNLAIALFHLLLVVLDAFLLSCNVARLMKSLRVSVTVSPTILLLQNHWTYLHAVALCNTTIITLSGFELVPLPLQFSYLLLHSVSHALL